MGEKREVKNMKEKSTDEMLAILKEQERRIIESDSRKQQNMEFKLHPKIDVEECLRNGYISADDYRKQIVENEKE